MNFKNQYLLLFVRIKRILISVTVAVYFVFTCGVTLNLHFCMGRFSSAELYKPPAKSCSTCGMRVKNPKCCHDEVKLIKLQNAHQHSSFVYNHEIVLSSLVTTFNYVAFTVTNEKASINKITHSPPSISQQDIYLQNGVFRI